MDNKKLFAMAKKQQIKAQKWDKLVAWIKKTKDNEDDDDYDADIWEFLGEELGIEADGRQNEKY